MNQVAVIFPHQLFKQSVLIDQNQIFYLIEEYLFFKQYFFHKQKIAFHRASMKSYQSYLEEKHQKEVRYIDSDHHLADFNHFSEEIKQKRITAVHLLNPCDDWLEKSIHSLVGVCEIKMEVSPMFLNQEEELTSFFRRDKKSFFQTTFYKQERSKRKLLLDENQKPQGGKWTYDAENRKRYPKGKIPPEIQFPHQSKVWDEACSYTSKHFSNHYGNLSSQRYYPITHLEAEKWLEDFLENRFYDFGTYEDAIVLNSFALHHSLLSPLLNTGLLGPQEVIDKALETAKKKEIPLNSLEGFIRQIIGWREFIRGMYRCKGRFSRTCNFWNFTRKIPSGFYEGSTGILPIDESIKKVLKTGYCHHIERLMILGNFMLLCEFDPDEVYRWFMELFIDAYDWVMVPNVYGMTLFADGGTFATKPYIGGSNYIRKMSNYPKGEWEKIWDGLFWRFVMKHQSYFRSNPRTGMLFHSLNRMSEEKRRMHFENGEKFLQSISRSSKIVG